jgi:hypothetical protein
MQRFSSWFPPQKPSTNIQADFPFSRNFKCCRSLRRIPRDFVSAGSGTCEMRGKGARTDTNSMLSVSLVKKAEQIEKPAKQIKDLSKG